MKSKVNRGVMAVVGLAAGLAFLAPSQARAQTVINIHTNLASVANATTNCPTGVEGTRVLPGEPASIWLKYSAVGTGTSNVVWGFDVSMDNTTWTTTQPIKMTNACNGTNVIVQRFQFSGTDVGAAKWIRLTYVSTTQTGAVQTTWARYAPYR